MASTEFGLVSTPEGAAGPGNVHCLPAVDTPESTQSESARQTKIAAARRELIRHAISGGIDQLQREIAIVDACLAAESDAGLLHGLRRAKAVWRCISESARELSELNETAP